MEDTVAGKSAALEVRPGLRWRRARSLLPLLVVVLGLLAPVAGPWEPLGSARGVVSAGLAPALGYAEGAPGSAVALPPAGDAGPALDDGPETDTGGRVLVAHGELDGRLRSALDRIDYPWRERLPGWQIAFFGPDPGLWGLTLVDERRIEIYLRDEQTADDVAGVIAHELGHAVDVTLLAWADRYEWLIARGHPPTAAWFVADRQSDFASGCGDFAEAFAVWQTGRESWSEMAGQPTPSHLELLVRLVDG